MMAKEYVQITEDDNSWLGRVTEDRSHARLTSDELGEVIDKLRHMARIEEGYDQLEDSLGKLAAQFQLADYVARGGTAGDVAEGHKDWSALLGLIIDLHERLARAEGPTHDLDDNPIGVRKHVGMFERRLQVGGPLGWSKSIAQHARTEVERLTARIAELEDKIEESSGLLVAAMHKATAKNGES